jgi:hypothetical protein
MNNRTRIMAKMPSLASAKSMLPRPRVIASMLLSTLILAGCGTGPIPTPAPTTPGMSAKDKTPATRPLACNEFKIVHFNPGKKDVTEKDIADALATKPDPIGHVRNVVGDNSETIVAVQEGNAAWHSLCDGK